MARPDYPFVPHPDDAAAKRAEALAWIPRVFRSLAFDGSDLVGYVSGGNPRLLAARRALFPDGMAAPLATSRKVVIIGAAGAGKTAVASAWLRGLILAGVDRARFVPALRLGETRPMPDARAVPWVDLAVTAAALVVDDLGAELTGAPSGGGLAAMRLEATSHLFHRRYDLGRGHVVTTPHDRNALTRIYGDGIARRVYEGAAVVKL